MYLCATTSLFSAWTSGRAPSSAQRRNDWHLVVVTISALVGHEVLEGGDAALDDFFHLPHTCSPHQVTAKGEE
jgi:hypothetical protein